MKKDIKILSHSAGCKSRADQHIQMQINAALFRPSRTPTTMHEGYINGDDGTTGQAGLYQPVDDNPNTLSGIIVDWPAVPFLLLFLSLSRDRRDPLTKSPPGCRYKSRCDPARRSSFFGGDSDPDLCARQAIITVIMVQIVGKYQYVSSENFEDYIKSLGKGDLVDTFLQSTPIVEIQQNGDQWIVVVTISQDKTVTTTFKPGEVYDEQLPSQGLFFKSVTTKEDNGFRTETTLSGDIIAIRLYEFTDTGMSVHLSSNKSDVKAKRTYKRL